MAARKPIKIKHPGALRARAKKAGRSVAAEAAADVNAPGLKGKQARLYKNVFAPANARRRKRGAK